jgi:hypothetical protein
MALGRRLVAQDRVRPGPEQRGPQNRLARRLPGEGGVHATLNLLPATTAYPVAHRAGIDADQLTLAAGDCGSLGGQMRQVFIG